MGTVNERKESNKQAGILSIVAGIILLIAGVTGAAAWSAISEFVESTIGDNATMEVVFAVFILFASFGGILVLIGGALFLKEKVRTAKFLLTLGVGMGLVGVIITLIVAISEGTLLNLSAVGLGFTGIVLSVIARMKAQKLDIDTGSKTPKKPSQKEGTGKK